MIWRNVILIILMERVGMYIPPDKTKWSRKKDWIPFSHVWTLDRKSIQVLFDDLSIRPPDKKMNKLIFHPPDRTEGNYPDRVSHFFIQTGTISSIESGFKIFCAQHIHDTEAGYVIWSGGNACDSESMHNYLATFSAIHKINVITYDYPGYGYSTGDASEYNCYLAHEHVVDYVMKSLKVDSSRITLIGYSLGTGVVSDYISNSWWHTKVYLIAPYKSICKVVYDSWITWFVDKFMTTSKIHKAVCPVQLVHGIHDAVILPYHSQDLHKLLSKPLKIIELDADHLSIIDHHVTWFKQK
jgi:hypothetical protein